MYTTLHSSPITAWRLSKIQPKKNRDIVPLNNARRSPNGLNRGGSWKEKEEGLEPNQEYVKQ